MAFDSAIVVKSLHTHMTEAPKDVLIEILCQAQAIREPKNDMVTLSSFVYKDNDVIRVETLYCLPCKKEVKAKCALCSAPLCPCKKTLLISKGGRMIKKQLKIASCARTPLICRECAVKQDFIECSRCNTFDPDAKMTECCSKVVCAGCEGFKCCDKNTTGCMLPPCYDTHKEHCCSDATHSFSDSGSDSD